MARGMTTAFVLAKKVVLTMSAGNQRDKAREKAQKAASGQVSVTCLCQNPGLQVNNTLEAQDHSVWYRAAEEQGGRRGDHACQAGCW